MLLTVRSLYDSSWATSRVARPWARSTSTWRSRSVRRDSDSPRGSSTSRETRVRPCRSWVRTAAGITLEPASTASTLPASASGSSDSLTSTPAAPHSTTLSTSQSALVGLHARTGICRQSWTRRMNASASRPVGSTITMLASRRRSWRHAASAESVCATNPIPALASRQVAIPRRYIECSSTMNTPASGPSMSRSGSPSRPLRDCIAPANHRITVR
ncbi:MAG: hypothetical protein AVDCRST_MAG67-3 [uncultured Solirubrobacteraceae bacterium]|uniref:Uncharacterized protein n=1 Tax=uncultured Solirubrobacteraceae bacterium TaxID=1162706 RepID=A0A6J4RD40_9ACTN|nr:MAG: hypothetical protein AVDCRST_MAG67-3 [uncultured Solirubrobacteraceae bacterium]